MFSWLLPLIVKIDAAPFEVIMTNCSKISQNQLKPFKNDKKSFLFHQTHFVLRMFKFLC